MRRAGVSSAVSAISPCTVRRCQHRAATKPWQRRSWIFSRDPDVEANAARVLDLYIRTWHGVTLGPDDYVISADENPCFKLTAPGEGCSTSCAATPTGPRGRSGRSGATAGGYAPSGPPVPATGPRLMCPRRPSPAEVDTGGRVESQKIRSEFQPGGVGSDPGSPQARPAKSRYRPDFSWHERSPTTAATALAQGATRLPLVPAADYTVGPHLLVGGTPLLRLAERESSDGVAAPGAR